MGLAMVRTAGAFIFALGALQYLQQEALYALKGRGRGSCDAIKSCLVHFCLVENMCICVCGSNCKDIVVKSLCSCKNAIYAVFDVAVSSASYEDEDLSVYCNNFDNVGVQLILQLSF